MSDPTWVSVRRTRAITLKTNALTLRLFAVHQDLREEQAASLLPAGHYSVWSFLWIADNWMALSEPKFMPASTDMQIVSLLLGLPY
ncbi:MAG: hypothetical protein ABJ246_12955 [Paracoccaceae bacterium]